jgi:hypothetical protein
MKNAQLVLRIPAADKKALEAIRRRDGIPLNEQVRRLIARSLRVGSGGPRRAPETKVGI